MWLVCSVYIRPVHKIFFSEFPKRQAVLYYMLIDKQMLEKVFCSNIFSSGNNLLYKAEYMGQSYGQKLIQATWPHVFCKICT